MECDVAADPAGTRSLQWRFATTRDATLLAELNHQLIADEGHRNAMSLDELEQRMCGWLSSEYTAVLFSNDETLTAYALYREDESGRIHLRQFFVVRELRRCGVGRAAMGLLRSKVLPSDRRIFLEVLTANDAARRFWEALGFQEYAVTLEQGPHGGSGK
jgi:ribosomal protein S18 acetylase RimI-like enzyme